MSEERYHKTYSVSWDQIQRDCRTLARELVKLRSWNRIIAVARGGLVPAAIMARELEVRLVDTVCISSYTLKNQGDMKILKRPDLDGVDENCLIIDDLVDTGKTAKVVREMFPKAYFATVYAKPEGIPMVDKFVTQVTQDTWILFPWESDAAFCDPIVDQEKQG
ncbi:PRPP-binding protein, adenine/guanine phosphoribosyltransferase [Thermanaerovibrio velox DSM 12556]|uniref:PRPP-binding protein, adenine/guanine phosphoribosyltransferase n=1 Tax=Thermanaerovibrio velox DSM 12556 TaxID=926567 RepID=H0UNQ6_9BACT|nr:xanthine phosphoribosyltransferase [Thermanaerovibrio velox]EHM10471.1 PRPP-binding protein, adenine/guanine phosphoribosyltransferase [Thermanaerovibrio velox DSM 12556]